MDVLKFLSSRDMREHLKKINYKFSALEAAWLVWHSEFIWDEKKKAYLEIMEEFEDMPLAAPVFLGRWRENSVTLVS